MGLSFGSSYGGWYGPYPYRYTAPLYGYPPVYGAIAYGRGGRYDGGVRLDVTPRDAAVYVDGYFAGLVDDFDGTFQRVDLDDGPHRIDIEASGHEPLSFNVNVPPNRTIRYRGDLRPLP